MNVTFYFFYSYLISLLQMRVVMRVFLMATNLTAQFNRKQRTELCDSKKRLCSIFSVNINKLTRGFVWRCVTFYLQTSNMAVKPCHCRSTLLIRLWFCGSVGLADTHLQLSCSGWLASRTSCRLFTSSLGTLYFPLCSLSAETHERIRTQATP